MAIRVCSASWTDKTLIACGRFYPPAVTNPEMRLRFYASIFPMVEVDSTYYALPSAANAARWAERTPDDFIFNVKAFRLFTNHPTPVRCLPRDVREALAGTALRSKETVFHRDLPAEIRSTLWQRFIAALEPLRMRGKLGAIHLQFPPWVQPDAEGFAHVADCAQRLDGFTIAAEFRHRRWFDAANVESTLDFEREIGAAHVVVDGPQGAENSVPAVWDVASRDLAIVRLHGRNADAYNRRDVAVSSGRFHYDYPDEEIASMVPAIERLSTQVRQLHVVFNNNHEDQGQRNARTLMKMLGAARGGARKL